MILQRQQAIEVKTHGKPVSRAQSCRGDPDPSQTQRGNVSSGSGPGALAPNPAKFERLNNAQWKNIKR